jgi:hypothetical protein
LRAATANTANTAQERGNEALFFLFNADPSPEPHQPAAARRPLWCRAGHNDELWYDKEWAIRHSAAAGRVAKPAEHAAGTIPAIAIDGDNPNTVAASSRTQPVAWFLSFVIDLHDSLCTIPKDAHRMKDTHSYGNRY